MITQSDDHSKVKKKKDVSRVLLDKDFGFGHHLAHYQVICNISCPLTDDLQHVQNSFHWLETKRQYKVRIGTSSYTPLLLQGLMRLINQFWDEELTSGECIDIYCNKDLMSQQEEYFKDKKSST